MKISNKKISMLTHIASQIRKDIIEMIWNAGSGHPGGSLSIADIIAALYFDILNIDSTNPTKKNRDRLVLSKGHACPAVYSALSLKGFFERDKLKTLRNIGSILQGHPDMNKTPGIDMTTGSLGQGLSAAVGMALGLRLENIDSYVFCIIGCGEMQEGQIWEAAMAAAHYKLDKLIAIVDYNRLQIDGRMDEVMEVEPVVMKWLSFGWYVIEINGHDFNQIIAAINFLKLINKKPKVLIANTIKGKSVSFMENVAMWHGTPLSFDQKERAIEEISKYETQCKKPAI
ncbi:MAG: transketolase [Actinobacteria bacterium]|nr:transketolase [Actinomycetota bacterium]